MEAVIYVFEQGQERGTAALAWGLYVLLQCNMEEVDTLQLELCYLSPKDEGRGDCTQGTHCAHVPVHAPE